MRGAAEACLHMLLPDEKGNLVTSPSTSPENRFKTDDGQSSWVCAGTATERQIIWELFNNVVMAGRALDMDSEFRNKFEAAQRKIRPPEIGRGGQLMEWGKDWDLKQAKRNTAIFRTCLRYIPDVKFHHFETPCLLKPRRSR